LRGEIILATEDDSLPEPQAFTKLLETMEKEKASFVQGNIIGRWGARVCPAWRLEERNGKPVVFWNDKEQEGGITEVQGVGWYCFVCPADIVRRYPMVVDDDLPLGPDVRFGYQLFKNGYKLLHRWDVKVEHFGEDFSYIPGITKTEQRMWYKKDDFWKTSEYNEAEKNTLLGI